METIRIALFASGSGSNAKNIIQYFKQHPRIQTEFVLTNKSDAGIVEWCTNEQFPIHIFSNDQVANGAFLVDFCRQQQIDVIILAGYLRKIPVELTQSYHERMINVHPALLPKFGGKGMYGAKVHEAVLANKESVTGITIHFVNEHFDEGRFIAQFSTDISSVETVEDIEAKVRVLEHAYFPFVIEQTLLKELQL